MNFQPLFTTARVITAVYRIASTTLLLAYLMGRVRNGQKLRRTNNQYRSVQRYHER